MVEEIINQYAIMRQNSGKNIISATPRQLESIIRLNEARARLRFSKFVEKEDVDEALNLIKIATQNAATDPVTGLIDIDMIQTGISTSSRININKLINIIKIILRDFRENEEKGTNYNSLKDEVKKRIKDSGNKISDFTEFDFKDALRKLEDENIISLLG